MLVLMSCSSQINEGDFPGAKIMVRARATTCFLLDIHYPFSNIEEREIQMQSESIGQTVLYPGNLSPRRKFQLSLASLH